VQKVAKHSLVTALVIVSALGASCVLFIEPATDLGGTCHFSGETATCGSCLVRACRAVVNQCCADGLCRGQVGDLDACATNGGAACSPIVSPFAPSPASDALASCLLQQCDKDCGSVSTLPTPVTPGGPGTPVPNTATSTSCDKDSTSKSCACEIPSVTAPANTLGCSPTSVSNALCCADLDWPLGGTRCDCKTVACATTNGGGGCKCTTFGEGPLTSCSTGGGCCSIGGSCECGANPNLCSLAPGTAGLNSVSSCGRTTIGCGTNRKAIARCSAQ